MPNSQRSAYQQEYHSRPENIERKRERDRRAQAKRRLKPEVREYQRAYHAKYDKAYRELKAAGDSATPAQLAKATKAITLPTKFDAADWD